MYAFDKFRVSDSTSVHAGTAYSYVCTRSYDLANHQLKIVETFRDLLPLFSTRRGIAKKKHSEFLPGNL
jgi:hypothetical protein